MRKRTHPRSHCESGQALIETALMIVVIITVVFSVFELGWLMYTYSVLADAANEGVRYAIVHSGGDPTGTQARVQTFAGASMRDVSAITTTVTFPDGGSSAPPNRVQVSVSYTYFPFLTQTKIAQTTMHSFAEGRMVAQ